MVTALLYPVSQRGCFTNVSSLIDVDGANSDRCGPIGANKLSVVVVVLNGGAQYNTVVTKEQCPDGVRVLVGGGYRKEYLRDVDIRC